jgi:hypothetical protein
MLGGETSDAEDLDGLIGDERTKNGRRVPWVVERHGGYIDDTTVAVAQRTVSDDEFAHAVAARRGRRKDGSSHHELLSVRAWP